MSDTLRPLPNFLLVAIPERFHAPKGPRSPEGLAISLLSGEDAMHELEQSIRAGGQVQIETDTDRSIRNLVRVGQVLQIPPTLTDQMYLCAAGEKYRTFADITPVVEVGDTAYLDFSCLTDENEILPGIYRVPYSAVICVINKRSDLAQDLFNVPPVTLLPVGGYVLLSRVWADDVEDAVIEGISTKVRYGKCTIAALKGQWMLDKNGNRIVSETNVPPLDNEGVVKWVDAPLKGALNELHPGQRVLITKGQALVETICGTEYLVIRHDYCMAVLKPNVIEFELEGKKMTCDMNKSRESERGQAFLGQNPFTKEFHRLPLDHPSYLA